MFKNIIFVLAIFISLVATKNTYAKAYKIENAEDVINCVLETHPNIIQAKTALPIAKENAKQANKWLNPEFDGGVGYNRDKEDKGVEFEAAILQTIELSGKRDARKNRAKSEIDLAILEEIEQKELVAFDILTTLNRARQIDSEKSILNETILSIKNTIKKYNNRPVLSPEDEISLEVFELALNDYEIEIDQLKNEEKELSKKLNRATNQNIKISKKIFLYAPKNWKNINQKEEKISESTELLKEDINIKIAKAGYLEAKAANFSEVRVGPYVQTKPNDFGRVDTYGMKVSFPIPIFSNSSQKKAGRLAVLAAEQNYDFKKREIEDTYSILQDRYNSGVKRLKKSSIKNIEQRHKKIESLFSKGRVSSSLFIEVHRQMVDVIKSNNQYEMETMQALWSIYLIEQNLINNIKEFSNV